MIRPGDIILDTSGTLIDQLRMRNDQTINDAISSLGITSSTEAVTEEGLTRNAVTLANGTYGGWISEKDNTIYKGIGAATLVHRKVIIAADCIIEGIRFVGSSQNTEELIHINLNATVVFRDCIFEKRNGDSSTYAVLATPVAGSVARAIFVGCVFTGPNMGAVINNPGAAANVNTVGCYDKTGGGFGGTTQFGNL